MEGEKENEGKLEHNSLMLQQNNNKNNYPVRVNTVIVQQTDGWQLNNTKGFETSREGERVKKWTNECRCKNLRSAIYNGKNRPHVEVRGHTTRPCIINY